MKSSQTNEFSGISEIVNRLMGIVESPSGLSSTIARIDPDLSWQVPDNWTLAEAATVPMAYSIAYCALFVSTKIQPENKILIHRGTEAVGLASLTIALQAGCTVFTTVDTKEQRLFLKSQFPQLPDNHIGSSRDTSFERLVLNETLGLGVDFVLNSLSGEKLQAGLRCLATDGRFIEIGGDLHDDTTTVNVSVFLKKNIRLNLVNFSDVKAKKLQIKDLIDSGIKSGTVKPLPLRVFTPSEIEDALRCKEHIGALLMKIHEAGDDNVVRALPRSYMNSNKSYVIVEGLGDLGIELANWMVTRGARILVLTSSCGVKSISGYQKYHVKRLRDFGVEVLISNLSMSDVEQLLEDAEKLAPVGGIFNLATTALNSKEFENIVESDLDEAQTAKVTLTRKLDIASRRCCPKLDCFVVFSHISASKDSSAGLSCQAMANSQMECIIENRRASGLPGLAIQWGPIDNVGTQQKIT